MVKDPEIKKTQTHIHCMERKLGNLQMGKCEKENVDFDAGEE